MLEVSEVTGSLFNDQFQAFVLKGNGKRCNFLCMSHCFLILKMNVVTTTVRLLKCIDLFFV